MTPDEIRSRLAGKSTHELHTLIEWLDGKARSIHQDADGKVRSLSGAEQDELRELLDLRKAAVQRLDEHAVISDVFDRVGGPNGGSVSAVFGSGSNGPDTAVVSISDLRGMSPRQTRDQALRLLDRESATRGRGGRGALHLSDAQREQMADMVEADNPDLDGSAVARRMLLTESPAYRSAFQQYLTAPAGVAPILSAAETEALRSYRELARDEMRALGEWTGTGGLGVPFFLDPTITITSGETVNPFRELADNIPVNTNQWKGVNSAGVTWSFDTESTAVSDDSPTLAQPTATIHMARGFVGYSIEVGMDYPGFAEEMSKLLAAGYEDLEISKLTAGSGTGEPMGILTALSANTNVRVRVTTSGTLGSPDPYKVWKALPQRWRARAAWLSSTGVMNAIRQLGATAGGNFTADLTQPTVPFLIGAPYRTTDYMPDTTTSTSATVGVAIVGDFKQMAVLRRVGMAVEPIPHLFDTTTGLPKGQRGLFAYARVGSTTKTDLAWRLLVNT